MSTSYELLFGSSSSDDDEVLSEFMEFGKFAWNAYQAYQASQPKVAKFTKNINNKRKGESSRSTTNIVTPYRYGAHDRLIAAYFDKHPMHDAYTFRKTFRMSRELFTSIVEDVTSHCGFFLNNNDCTETEGVSALMKCTSAIRQLAYDTEPNALDEFLQMGAETSRDSLEYFCRSVIKIYGAEYLRKPTITDREKLYRFHEEKYGFPGMLGSLDCTDWEWFGCPNNGSNPFIVLEAVASQDLWIWHAFLGVPEINYDIRLIHQSPIFHDLKYGIAPEVPFEANGEWYRWGYYLVNEKYPEWATLVNSISHPNNDDHKQIRYNRMHEAAKKDVERAFGVLKKKWAILGNPARAMSIDKIKNMMYTCIILHNMIRKHKGKAISPNYYPAEEHREYDPVRTREQARKVFRQVKSAYAHQILRDDLVEHLSRGV